MGPAAAAGGSLQLGGADRISPFNISSPFTLIPYELTIILQGTDPNIASRRPSARRIRASRSFSGPSAASDTDAPRVPRVSSSRAPAGPGSRRIRLAGGSVCDDGLIGGCSGGSAPGEGTVGTRRGRRRLARAATRSLSSLAASTEHREGLRSLTASPEPAEGIGLGSTGGTTLDPTS